MKKLFIDGGARIGESIDILLSKRPDLDGCDVDFFECNPAHIDALETIKNQNTKYKFTIWQAAIWNKNETKLFYFSIDRWGDLGCTLKPEKNEKLDIDNPILVRCINLADYLDTIHPDTYIVLKLDIEGAEYEVLENLINSGRINRINELYVEFHDMFFGISSADLKNRLSTYNIKCNFDWE